MTKIDWTKWSAIAEISSAVAIVATLLYLSVQTQYLAEQTEQNNLLLDAQGSYNLLQNRVAPRWETFNNPDVAEIMLKVQNGEQLDPLEEFRYLTRLEAEIIGLEWEYQRWVNGSIDYFPVDQMKRFMNDPAYRELGWEPSRQFLSEEFVEFVETEILED